MSRSQYMREWSAQRKAKGLCLKCPEPATKGVLCRACHAQEVARRRAHSRNRDNRIPTFEQFERLMGEMENE